MKNNLNISLHIPPDHAILAFACMSYAHFFVSFLKRLKFLENVLLIHEMNAESLLSLSLWDGFLSLILQHFLINPYSCLQTDYVTCPSPHILHLGAISIHLRSTADRRMTHIVPKPSLPAPQAFAGGTSAAKSEKSSKGTP